MTTHRRARTQSWVVAVCIALGAAFALSWVVLTGLDDRSVASGDVGEGGDALSGNNDQTGEPGGAGSVDDAGAKRAIRRGAKAGSAALDDDANATDLAAARKAGKGSTTNGESLSGSGETTGEREPSTEPPEDETATEEESDESIDVTGQIILTGDRGEEYPAKEITGDYCCADFALCFYPLSSSATETAEIVLTDVVEWGLGMLHYISCRRSTVIDEKSGGLRPGCFQLVVQKNGDEDSASDVDDSADTGKQRLAAQWRFELPAPRLEALTDNGLRLNFGDIRLPLAQLPLRTDKWVLAGRLLHKSGKPLCCNGDYSSGGPVGLHGERMSGAPHVVRNGCFATEGTLLVDDVKPAPGDTWQLKFNQTLGFPAMTLPAPVAKGCGGRVLDFGDITIDAGGVLEVVLHETVWHSGTGNSAKPPQMLAEVALKSGDFEANSPVLCAQAPPDAAICPSLAVLCLPAGRYRYSAVFDGDTRNFYEVRLDSDSRKDAVWVVPTGVVDIEEGQAARIDITPRALRVEHATVHVRMADGAECKVLSGYRYTFEPLVGSGIAAADVVGLVDVANGHASNSDHAVIYFLPLDVPVVEGFATCLWARRSFGPWSETLRILPGTSEAVLEVKDGETGPTLSCVVRMPTAPVCMEEMKIKIRNQREDGGMQEYERTLTDKSQDEQYYSAAGRFTYTIIEPTGCYGYPSPILSQITVDMTEDGQIVELPPIAPPPWKFPAKEARISITCGGARVFSIDTIFVWPNGERTRAGLYNGQKRDSYEMNKHQFYPIAVVDGDQTIPTTIKPPQSEDGIIECLIELEPRIEVRATHGGVPVASFAAEAASGGTQDYASDGAAILWVPVGETNLEVNLVEENLKLANPRGKVETTTTAIRGQLRRVEIDLSGAVVRFTRAPKYEQTEEPCTHWRLIGPWDSSHPFAKENLLSGDLARLEYDPARLDDILDRVSPPEVRTPDSRCQKWYLKPGTYFVEPYPLLNARDVIRLDIKENDTSRTVEIPWIEEPTDTGQAVFSMPDEVVTAGNCDMTNFRVFLRSAEGARPRLMERWSDVERFNASFRITREGIVASGLPRGAPMFVAGDISCGASCWAIRPTLFKVAETGTTQTPLEWHNVQECVPYDPEWFTTGGDELDSNSVPGLLLKWEHFKAHPMSKVNGEIQWGLIPGIYALTAVTNEGAFIATATLTVRPGDVTAKIPPDLRAKLISLGKLTE